MENEPQYLKDASAAAFHWYQQADTKAQIILGFSGVFLSIMIGALFSMEDTSVFIAQTDAKTILGAVMVGHLAAIFLSVFALWSRGIFFDKTQSIDFFGRIANYEDAKALHKAIQSTTEEGLLPQSTVNLFKLSRNTRLKHRLVDIAAVISSLSLLGTVLAAIYIVIG